MLENDMVWLEKSLRERYCRIPVQWLRIKKELESVKQSATPTNKQSAEYLCVCGSSTVYKSVNGSAFRCMDCHRMWKV